MSEDLEQRVRLLEAAIQRLDWEAAGQYPRVRDQAAFDENKQFVNDNPGVQNLIPCTTGKYNIIDPTD